MAGVAEPLEVGAVVTADELERLDMVHVVAGLPACSASPAVVLLA
jgi:hypothetical protein